METRTGHNEGGVFLMRRVGWVPVAPALESFGDQTPAFCSRSRPVELGREQGLCLVG